MNPSSIFPIEEENLPVDIVVVEMKVSQSQSACKVEEEEVVENKTWREATSLIRQEFTSYGISLYLLKSP